MLKKIKINNWEYFRVGDLFNIHPTKAYKLTNSALMEEDGQYPVIVNSSYNNGVGGFTNQEPTENGGIITFSDTTSAEAIFFQKSPFVGYPHVQGMYPIGKYASKWTELSSLFFVSVFRNKAINLNYDYVNKFTRTSASEIMVKLPVDENHQPDFSYMEEYMKNREIAVSASLTKLQSAKQFSKLKKASAFEWKKYHLYDIFDIDSGTKLDKAKMDTSDNEIDFVGRSNANNGITQKVKRIKNLAPYKSGNLTLALGGAYLGSCFVQENDFYTSQNVVVLIPKNEMSFFSKQFIASAIFKESQNNYKAFIKELNAHVKKDFVIKLPADKNGNPDYDYMETYMKNIANQTSCVLKQLKNVI